MGIDVVAHRPSVSFSTSADVTKIGADPSRTQRLAGAQSLAGRVTSVSCNEQPRPEGAVISERANGKKNSVGVKKHLNGARPNRGCFAKKNFSLIASKSKRNGQSPVSLVSPQTRAAGIPTRSQPAFPASSTLTKKSVPQPPPTPKVSPEQLPTAGFVSGSGQAVATSWNLVPRTSTALWDADTTPAKKSVSRVDPATRPGAGISSNQAKTSAPAFHGRKKSPFVQATRWQESLRNNRGAEAGATSGKKMTSKRAEKLRQDLELPMNVQLHNADYRRELDIKRADAQVKAKAEANAIRYPLYFSEKTALGSTGTFFIPLQPAEKKKVESQEIVAARQPVMSSVPAPAPVAIAATSAAPLHQAEFSASIEEEIGAATPQQLPVRDQGIATDSLETRGTSDSGNDSDSESNVEKFPPSTFAANVARNASRQAQNSFNEFRRLTADTFSRTPSEGFDVQQQSLLASRRGSGTQWRPVLRESNYPEPLTVSGQPFLEINPGSLTQKASAKSTSKVENKRWVQTARGTWEKKNDATSREATAPKATTVELTSNRRQGSRVAGMLEQQQKRQQAFNADSVKSVQLTVRPLRDSSESAGADRSTNESVRPGSIRNLINFWENKATPS
jgi:hypothetical protein